MPLPEHLKRDFWVKTELREDGWVASCGDDGGEFAKVHGSKQAGPDAALTALVPYMACMATESDPFAGMFPSEDD